MLLARLAAGPIDATGLSSASRNSTTSTASISSKGFRGILFYLDLTVYGGAGLVYPIIEALDPASGKWITLVSFNTAISSVSAWSYAYGPGVSAGSGATIAIGDRGGLLPSTFRLTVYHSTANAHTYSLGYSLIP